MIKSSLLSQHEVFHGFLGAPEENHPTFVSLKQVHSANVYCVDDLGYPSEGDGLMTACPGQIVSIDTADCVPLLMYDPVMKIVAAVHAGWRGACAGIVATAVKEFVSRKSNPKDLVVAIGPAICADHYPVGPEVREAFIAQNPAWGIFFKPDTSHKYLLDLKAMIAYELTQSGVRAIDNCDICTYEDPGFYSHRLTTHKGEHFRMRNVSFIGIAGSI